jgi:hypothetical protein
MERNLIDRVPGSAIKAWRWKEVRTACTLVVACSITYLTASLLDHVAINISGHIECVEHGVCR